ncbi:MAG: glycyl-radical enzyme activating protein [Ruminococcaceae bacterium]|nr:glycyl-radical enzyme activating protein [Oscillospiraceae bacterium]
MSVKATVTNYSKGSIHDGPGLRTVVYLKGCALLCRWCHNPENLGKKPEILYIKSKCIHCGRCINTCPEHHHILQDEMVLERDGCKLCGKCAEACPSGALTLCGQETTPEEAFAQILKDAHYYEQTGGGVTLSGGECLLYPEFCAELFGLCKKENIHTAIETALFVPWENIERVLPYCDLIFADLKIADSKKHREYTGQDNRLILENLKQLSHKHSNITLRIPLIPGVNDSPDDMKQFAEIILTLGDGVKEIELLRYNHMAEGKYQMTGRSYESFAADTQSPEQVETLCSVLREASNHKYHVFFVS